MQATEEEKEQFLQNIRDGDDQATAARRINPDLTATKFKRMCNPLAPRTYDAEFHAAYVKALEERGPLDPDRPRFWEENRRRTSSTTTPQGWTKADHLTEEQLQEFLEHVRDGVMAWKAAGMIDPPTSITQIHRRRDRDPAFAEELKLALEEGLEAYREALRAEASRQGFAGNYNALKDQMMIHLPEARALMTSRHEIGLDAALQIIAPQLANLPREMLDEVIRTLEESEMKQLGPGS